MRATPPIPPTTPPAIAPVFEVLDMDGEGDAVAGVVEVGDGGDVVPAADGLEVV